MLWFWAQYRGTYPCSYSRITCICYSVSTLHPRYVKMLITVASNCWLLSYTTHKCVQYSRKSYITSKYTLGLKPSWKCAKTGLPHPGLFAAQTNTSCRLIFHGIPSFENFLIHSYKYRSSWRFGKKTWFCVHFSHVSTYATCVWQININMLFHSVLYTCDLK